MKIQKNVVELIYIRKGFNMKISTLLFVFLAMIQINAEAVTTIGAKERDTLNTRAKAVWGEQTTEEILSLKADPGVVRDAMAKRSNQILELARSIKVNNPQIVVAVQRVPHIVTLMALLESPKVTPGLKKAAIEFMDDLASSPFKIGDSKESLKILNSILEKAPGMQDIVERLLKDVLDERRSGDSLAVSFNRVMKTLAKKRNMAPAEFLDKVFRCKV